MAFRMMMPVVLCLTLGGCPATTTQGGTGQPPPGGSEVSAGGRDESALTGEQLEEIQRTVRVGNEAINGCFTDEMERQANRKLAGKVLVKILIGTNRTAEQVVFGEHTLTGAEFLACLEKTIKSWEFPAIPSPSWFSYPFEFSPAY